jgi:hypothetical protein
MIEIVGVFAVGFLVVMAGLVPAIHVFDVSRDLRPGASAAAPRSYPKCSIPAKKSPKPKRNATQARLM